MSSNINSNQFNNTNNFTSTGSSFGHNNWQNMKIQQHNNYLNTSYLEERKNHCR